MHYDFDIFYWAAMALTHGLSPYTVPGFFNPAWALIPFIPLTLLPIEIARVAWQLISLAGILFALWKWELKPDQIAIVVLASPLVWLNLWYANVDWLVVLGATLAPEIGLWLMTMKPQVSIGLLLLNWRLMLLPAIALIANYALLGLPKTMDTPWSAPADWFPWGVPIGLHLLYRCRSTGIQHKKSAGLAAGAFLSPYYSITSYLSFAPLATTWKRVLLVLVLSWCVFVMWRLQL